MTTTLLETPPADPLGLFSIEENCVDTPLEIPEELQRRIEEGKKQLAAGQGIPFDVVMKKMRQRFQCER